ncbi:iron complex transport system substrate-binding protein [Quadrisphaera granulorum]|uniref:Iron complex transport system substrate-binding protein n=1 Tax=Quadrisphaera granulorum TaxID=317664 RepID=A0A316AB23_9ACTN|nr:iron-siderophore ABC transporter substrate-binding protein [Quadrisphaera granulorum]PWJ54200.1 iron complex transport system substrate-binding protein [Quadrisphaera granulorum]SZE96339.1 iron complex transport system substrate-binding protein [Quadrisphaera granulorum]
MTTPALFRPAALATALLSAALLAGCSAAGASSSSAGSASEAAPAVSESGVHAVTHARGTTEVPDAPQRVVVLEPVQLDTAVALDVVPVGAAVVNATAGVPAYLGVGDRVKPVGTVSEPDLEAIAALAPDLILGTEARHSKLYDQLSQIAPTVFQTSQTDPWQDSVRLVGEALGKPEAATAALGTYTQRCEQVRSAHPTSGMTAQLVRPRDETTLSLYSPTSFAGSTMECAGLTIPPREWAQGIQTDISPEQIAQAKADLVLVTAADPAAIPAAITANPADFPRVVAVDTSWWISGVGPLGGQKVLDDLDRILSAGS